ncbi:MAG TPA: hypothetical protein VIT64_15135 [Ilumatobacteraceae bacterium]
MDEYSTELLTSTDRAVAGWVERCVRSRLMEAGEPFEPHRVATVEAGAAARAQVRAELSALLELDVDSQRTNPLAVLRRAVVHPTAVLRAAGVAPVARTEFDVRAFPEDVYNLSPATWRDVAEELHEPGLVWGAWKAKTVLDRRRAEGRR